MRRPKWNTSRSCATIALTASDRSSPLSTSSQEHGSLAAIYPMTLYPTTGRPQGIDWSSVPVAIFRSRAKQECAHMATATRRGMTTDAPLQE